MSAPAIDASLLHQLTLQAAAVTGFSEEAILQDAVRRAAELLLREMTPTELLQRAQRREPTVVHALGQAVSVGETYFFRQPEHFHMLAALVPQLVARGVPRICAWSAGCATGEEAYSMAACLLGSLPFGSGAEVSVLGTDLVSRNVAAARLGIYGAWSQRPAGPLLYPLLQPLPLAATTPNPLSGAVPQRTRVDDRVRRVTRFAERNLLERSAEGPFEVIFCRNVLVYFAREAAERALGHLVDVLVPGGVIAFGSMDATHAPRELLPLGPAEDQVFRKPGPAQPGRPLKAPPPPPPPASPAPQPLPARAPRPPEPVALHLRALVHIEHGAHAAAELALSDLLRAVPDYLPGILELALLHGRAGERTHAAALMREVLRRTAQLPPGELVAGPEPLPASFYRASAENFLRAAQGPGGAR